MNREPLIAALLLAGAALAGIALLDFLGYALFVLSAVGGRVVTPLEGWSRVFEAAPVAAGAGLLSLGVSVVVSVGGTLAAFRARSERRGRAAAAFCFGVVGVTLVGHLAAIAWERDRVIRTLLEGGASDVSSTELAWHLAVVVLLFGPVPLTLLATARVQPAMRRALAHSVVAIVFCVGVVAGLLLVSLHAVVGAGATETAISEVSLQLDLVRWIPAVVAALTGAILLLRRPRFLEGHTEVGRSGVTVSLMLGLTILGSGAFAFAHTRAHAADRGVRLSLRSHVIPEALPFDALPPRRSPSRPLEIDSPGWHDPLITLRHGGGFALDGVEGGENAIGQELASRRGRWARRHPRLPFSPRVLVAAPADAPTSAIAPVLRQAFTAGYPWVGIVLAEREAVHARTLGNVERRRLYVVDFRMRGSEEHVDRAPRTLPTRWGEIVEDIDPRGDGYLVP